MAGSSLLTLLDDIAAVLDDVAMMTKMAAKKTSGVLGDDLALNAQQVSGVRAEREIPVVWSVAKGSFLNKLILVPLALLISAFIPWAITPLLMLGGAYLCFEGAEKIAHKIFHSNAKLAAKTHSVPEEKLAEFEKEKIKGAIRTDFILSAEIIAITLGIVSTTTIINQLAVLSLIAVMMTIGVYGLVAGIVKLDDLGFYLQKKTSALLQKIGNGLIYTTPYLMKTLSVVGTAAMFMVGGGILTHGIRYMSEWIEEISFTALLTPIIGSTMQFILPTIINLFFGFIVGMCLVMVLSLIKKIQKA
ncbi:TPA: DUF808 domain-containing protein [Providencia stuartii]|nr:DUF808 domain-containing protein [Providencia stuartii]